MCDERCQNGGQLLFGVGSGVYQRGHVGLGGGIDAPGTMTEAWVVESEHLSECSRWHP